MLIGTEVELAVEVKELFHALGSRHVMGEGIQSSQFFLGEMLRRKPEKKRLKTLAGLIYL
jgi:hypothetical protein